MMIYILHLRRRQAFLTGGMYFSYFIDCTTSSLLTSLPMSSVGM